MKDHYCIRPYTLLRGSVLCYNTLKVGNQVTIMTRIRDVNYFSLDLELNNKSDGSVPKIIEVGISIASPTNPDEAKTFNWYLDPQEPIVPFITKLTGITDQDIKEKAVSHEVVAKELGDILNEYQCFPNPVTWGQGDASELKDEFRQNDIHFPFFGRRIIDVKTVYVFLEQVSGRSPSGSLSKSMRRYGIPFIGKPHRASVDAYNTLMFYFYLMNRQEKLEVMVNACKSIKY